MPDNITMEIKGTEDFHRRMENIAQHGPEALGRALYSVGSDIFADSQRVVPVEYGTLKSSGGIEGPQEVDGEMEVVIYYGGAAAEYAVYVHENLEAHHVDPTSAKFLEGPFIAHLQDVPVAAGIEIAKAIARDARS